MTGVRNGKNMSVRNTAVSLSDWFISRATPSAPQINNGTVTAVNSSVRPSDGQNSGSAVKARMQFSSQAYGAGLLRVYRVNDVLSEKSMGPAVNPPNPTSHGDIHKKPVSAS